MKKKLISAEKQRQQIDWAFISILIFDIAENISFDPTIYFQPSIENFENDYKASMILALDFKVNENFKIRMQYSSFHDSDPPMLAEKTDDSISTMFSYDLSKLWKD
jgi:putative salt-induced outer membrane protein YdiY